MSTMTALAAIVCQTDNFTNGQVWALKQGSFNEASASLTSPNPALPATSQVVSHVVLTSRDGRFVEAGSIKSNGQYPGDSCLVADNQIRVYSAASTSFPGKYLCSYLPATSPLALIPGTQAAQFRSFGVKYDGSSKYSAYILNGSTPVSIAQWPLDNQPYPWVVSGAETVDRLDKRTTPIGAVRTSQNRVKRAAAGAQLERWCYDQCKNNVSGATLSPCDASNGWTINFGTQLTRSLLRRPSHVRPNRKNTSRLRPQRRRNSRSEKSEKPFIVRSLLGASDAEIREYLLDFYGRSTIGEIEQPEILALRPVKPQELPRLDKNIISVREFQGLNNLSHTVLKGKFAVGKLPEGEDPKTWYQGKFNYVGAVLDRETGEIIRAAAATKNDDFRQAISGGEIERRRLRRQRRTRVR
jgi:hypothetical protein